MTADAKTLRSLGHVVRLHRKQRGLTLPTVAKLSGVSKGNLSKVENGGNVTVLTLYRIGWVIGVHPKYLLPAFQFNRRKKNAP